MKCFAILAAALGLAGATTTRFDRTVDGLPRSLISTSSNSRSRAYRFRPTNTTYDFTTEFGVHGHTAPYVRSLLFNKTTDTTPLVAYRVGILRLAEIEGDGNALNATNVLHLNSTDGSTSVSSVNDRTVNGTTIKGMRLDWRKNGFNTQPTLRIDAEVPLGNVTDNGKELSADTIMWSVTINNFVYTATNDSKLAMVVSVNSPLSRNVTRDVNNTITGVDIGNGNGTFHWNSTILVNNVAKSLTVTDLTDDANVGMLMQANSDASMITDEQVSYLQFLIEDVKPNNIVWNPLSDMLAEDDALGNGAASMVASVATLMAAVLVVAL